MYIDSVSEEALLRAFKIAKRFSFLSSFKAGIKSGFVKESYNANDVKMKIQRVIEEGDNCPSIENPLELKIKIK